MTQYYPIKMFNLLFFCHLKPIDKYFGLRLRNDIKLLTLLQYGTVTLADTQRIDLNVILLYLVGTNVSLALL